MLAFRYLEPKTIYLFSLDTLQTSLTNFYSKLQNKCIEFHPPFTKKTYPCTI